METLSIQPVAVRYNAPAGEDDRFYGWFSDMTFGPHVQKVLARHRQGSVTVAYLDPLKVSDYADRKALAQACEKAVRAGLESLD